MAVTLRLKKELKVPINAECISPDVFAGKSLDELAKLQLWEGNRKRLLREIFKIEGNSGKTPSEVSIRLIGNLSKVQKIGAGMTDGEIKVQGNVGMHLGEKMKGGKITVEGNAGSWVGSAMKGGMITVEGSAGDYIGGAYRGSTRGMHGGTIIIHGDAGTEVGGYMRKGLIKVCGDVGQFVGIRMRNGTIVVQGKAKERAGAFMKGGKIILCNYIPSVLPTFTIEGIKAKVKVGEEKITGPFYLFVGDLAEHGSGKLYVSKTQNGHLKGYEEFL
jgi:formylmethanofuran dehydrogenase subunit C